MLRNPFIVHASSFFGEKKKIEKNDKNRCTCVCVLFINYYGLYAVNVRIKQHTRSSFPKSMDYFYFHLCSGWGGYFAFKC